MSAQALQEQKQIHLPNHYHEWSDEDSTFILNTLQSSEPVHELTLDEIRNILHESLGDRTLSSVVREIRDEGY